MSESQVQLVLRALQGLQAHKVYKVLKELRVQRDLLAQQDRQVLKEFKE
jgi:hypothetical protein